MDTVLSNMVLNCQKPNPAFTLSSAVLHKNDNQDLIYNACLPKEYFITSALAENAFLWHKNLVLHNLLLLIYLFV